MSAEVVNISTRRDQKRFDELDELHDEYLGQWLAIMLHKDGVQACKDMSNLNKLIDAVQIEMEDIKQRSTL